MDYTPRTILEIMKSNLIEKEKQLRRIYATIRMNASYQVSVRQAK